MGIKGRTAAALCAGALMVTAAAVPATAQTKQDGLVNVSVGDVTILQDVNIAATVDVVAQVCGIDLDVVANVVLLSEAAQRVDDRSRNFTVCKTEDGKVQITQN